jgi:cytochrome c553
MTLVTPTKPISASGRTGEMPACDKARKRSSVIGGRLAMALAIIAAAAFSAAGSARSAGTSRHSVQAKIRYCEDCHGISAQGYRGYYAIPRLAGQQPQYLKNQLRAFVNRSRPNPIMSNVAHVLRPDMIEAIANYFRRLNPRPIGGEPKRLVAEGRSIFENGVPQNNIAACAACHGPQATGNGEIPRLAGQLYPYVVKALSNFPKERGQNPAIHGTSFIMLPVAHSLNRSQIKAVAAYVSSLR